MISGYGIVEEIYRGRRRVVYRGNRDHDGVPVIIKTFTNDFLPQKDIAALKHEYDILHNLKIDGIPKTYGLDKYNGRPALILEDIGGEPLRNLIDAKQIDLTVFLEIGIQLSRIVGELHQNNVIHKDINPKNVIVNLRTRQVRLIDFSISSLLPFENPTISYSNLLEGTLAYISPEQTGRMNRAIDYRTDFYSLGITFYEMLTGKLPFNSSDPLELVHFHIAKIPIPPHELNPPIPQVISNIVMKLLAKTAEERYKSAYGLKADLEACLVKWQASQKIEDFVPGQNDFSDRFQIPQKLYGREEEIETLMATFERVSDGTTEMMLVSGYSGIGKTALISEVHKPIVRQKGYFISGKFDQFKRNIPYSAVIQAFQELVRQLLTESENQVGDWKDRLTDALGPNGQVIVDVIPEVELIIGRQPAVPELPPTESQNRFNLVFERFIGVFAQKQHPLVMFLDDLQWADSATLNLLKILMADPNIQFLFVIGAYRDNEVSPAHPLIRTLSEIEKTGARLRNVTLKPLGFTHLNQLIADTLRCETTRSKPLAELVLSKTDGNPFFVTQFLKSLYQERLVQLDYDSGEWQFDLDRVYRMGMTDNVVELMAGKIQRLSKETQHISKLAACVGNQFDLNTLAIVNERSLSQTAHDLWEAIREGLILPISDLGLRIAESSSESEIQNPRSAIYRFLHDRVQQAAYALIPDDQKKTVHLKIGRLMLQHSDENEREEQLFDIVNHFNIGLELITEQEERIKLTELNLQAGQKAKSSTAYKPALSYLNIGLNLLSVDKWTSEYEPTFTLYRELAECEYLCGNFDKAEEYFDLLLSRAGTNLEKAQIYNMKIIQYENMAQYTKAVQAGAEGLKLFGIVFPETEEEKKTAFHDEMQVIQTRLGKRQIEDLVHLPVMTEPEMKMGMKLLMTVWAPAYIAADVSLTVLISAKMVSLSLLYGNTEESAYAYVIHAVTVGTGLGDYRSGYEYGRLALSVNEKFNDLNYRAKIHHMFSCFVNFWRMPLKTCFTHSKEAYRSGLESGDFAYSTYAVIHESWHALLSGFELSQFNKDYTPNVSFLKQIKNYSFADAQQLILQWGLNLQGLTESKYSFSDNTFDEETYLQTYKGNAFFETFYFATKLHILYTFEKYSTAKEMALNAEGVIHALHGTLWDAVLCFYQALTLTALYHSATAKDQKEFWKKLEDLRTKMKIWAANCPENFLNQYLLISAEMTKITDRYSEAMDLYEGAIRSARENGFIQNEALANELYARYWLQRRNEKIARLYMAEAHYMYKQWGAMGKAKDLEEKYPQLLSQSRMEDRTRIGDLQMSLTTVGLGSAALDLMTVIKASQVISGEIVLEQLLEKLMKIAIENAGAEKGILLLEKGEELVVEAEGSVNRDEVTVLHSIPGGAHGSSTLLTTHLPQTVINYVKRTHESVVLADAGNDSKFGNDPYIARNKPKSIFCIPILNQGKLTGTLYLENNLITGAFTPDRIEVIQILSSQAAISLENARLYDEMKQEVAQRKQAERALKHTAAELRFLNDLVEQTNQPVAVADFDGRLIRFNRAYEHLTGYSSDELRHMTYKQLTPESWGEFEIQQIARLISEGQPVRYEKEYRRKNGTLVPLELVVDIYRNAADEPVYLYAFVTDITERKRAEEALRKALLEVEQLKNRLQVENVYLQEEIKTEYNFEEIIGQSESLKKVLRKVEQVAPTDATVLIHGETGTGKELIARAIHNLSPRKGRPLVKVNCGAISAGLVESELFGHEKGAFTGALQQRIGRFELADGGTIFLDEVGELPPDTQVKILRVLQEGEFERVGSSKPVKVDVRVIAATNRNLVEAIKSGSFRSDLFYRLNVFPIEVPSLRERKTDIPLLANFFITKYARKLNKEIQGISKGTLDRLMNYHWPGNIRELQNIIERAVVLSPGSGVQIHESLLGLGIGSQASGTATLDDVERAHILRVLEQTNWLIQGKGGAASILGINPNTLRSRMQKLGIKKPKRALNIE